MKSKAFEEYSIIDLLKELSIDLRTLVDYMERACECMDFTKDMLKSHSAKSKTTKDIIGEIGNIFNCINKWFDRLMPAEVEYTYRKEGPVPELKSINSILSSGSLGEIKRALDPTILSIICNRLTALGNKLPGLLKKQITVTVINSLQNVQFAAKKVAHYYAETAVINKKTGELKFMKLSYLTEDAKNELQPILTDYAIEYPKQIYTKAVTESEHVFTSYDNQGRPTYNIKVDTKKPLKAWYASDGFDNMEASIKHSLQFFTLMEV